MILFTSEARMHSFGHRWTVVVALLVGLLTAGCRSPGPLGRFVKVSKKSDTGLPEIEAPPQRLATAKPRVEVEVSAKPHADQPRSDQLSRDQAPAKNWADDSPHVTRTASTKSPRTSERSEVVKPSAKPKSKQLAASKPANKSKRVSGSRSEASTRESSKPNSNQVARRESPKQSGAGKSDSVPSRSNSDRSEKSSDAIVATAQADSERMSAFSDYPPEVQKEAMRRLVAATSRSAQRTGQPNSLQQQLAGITDLPTLPGLKHSTPEVPPTRIATDQLSPLSSASLMQDTTKPSSLTLPAGVGNSLTDLITTELESNVVQAASEAMSQESKVQAASASRHEDEKALITRASVEEPALLKSDESVADASEIAKQVKDAVEDKDDASDADVAEPQNDISDKELYAALLKRLSSPSPGESEADRSSRLIKLRHLMVLAGNPDDAVAEIKDMSTAEQEYLRHQLLGLWTMIDPDGHPTPSRRFSSAVPQIREAAKFAAAATDALEVRSLSFCTEIESYGQIKAFPGNRFNPGQQVIMYCEIENFTAKKTDDGFETNLQGSYDIYNEKDEKVISQLLPADQQVSANYLRDYFIAYQMHLPQQLDAGTYRMQLTMEDVNGKKYGQTSIPFEIAK